MAMVHWLHYKFLIDESIEADLTESKILIPNIVRFSHTKALVMALLSTA